MLAVTASVGTMGTTAFHGPLRPDPTNPRYFTDDSGRVRYLTGSHTWANLVDVTVPGQPPFDYARYLDMLTGHGHSFTRMWTWDHPTSAPWSRAVVSFDPMPYGRTEPGSARFDLDRWNDAYFHRLRERVSAAADRGIYVSVMLFEGYAVKWSAPGDDGDAWLSHPFHRDNNVNGVDGDPDGDGRGDVYGLVSPAVTERQEAYVRKVVDTLGDLDNVLWEIINEVEDTERGTAWQQHMVDVVHTYEATRPKQHPVGMTAESGNQDNDLLFAGPADWISPGFGPGMHYRHDPPDTEGRKVVVADTDHLWGHGGSYRWAWKSFLRGLNPIFMDSWEPIPGLGPDRADGCPISDLFNRRDYPDWEPLRRNLGETRRLADRIDLRAATPRADLASSTFCLAHEGHDYVVYVPDDAQVTVDLRGTDGDLAVNWLHPATGEWRPAEPVSGGAHRNLISPFGLDAVVHLTAV